MKFRTVALPLAAVLGTSAPAQTVEQGYPRGSLAVAALERQDWRSAERLLNQPNGVSRDDPARLINLGWIYAATGRVEMARYVFEQALAAKRHVEVETISGKVMSTRDLSRLALKRLGPETETASR